jgi:aminocarboxymuconate-semialdehyde decarboxylase
VLERLPKLRVCFAHGGGSFPGTLGRIEHGFRSRPDLCAVETKKSPCEQLKRVYVDSLVHDADILRLLLKQFGPERIALGTDYPFPLGENSPGKLIASMRDLSPTVRERIFSGTALEFLGLSKTLQKR